MSRYLTLLSLRHILATESSQGQVPAAPLLLTGPGTRSTPYGMTPIQFHQHNRIEKAKEKILYSDASLTEIAEHMGFASIHAFSRAFKKIEHVSPSSYRMSLNNS